MANKTINGITTELDSVASADLLPVWDASEGKTAKVSKSNFLGLDNYPTANSSNPAKSSGIFSANAVIMASSTTITNAPTISSSSIIRVMFTSAITGSNTTTALSLSYNGTSYPVKVGKQGSLSNFVASYVNSAYTYLQAYTTLELAFDGSQFIIIGNPVVLSSSDYTIYADGESRNYNSEPVYYYGEGSSWSEVIEVLETQGYDGSGALGTRYLLIIANNFETLITGSTISAGTVTNTTFSSGGGPGAGATLYKLNTSYGSCIIQSYLFSGFICLAYANGTYRIGVLIGGMYR